MNHMTIPKMHPGDITQPLVHGYSLTVRVPGEGRRWCPCHTVGSYGHISSIHSHSTAGSSSWSRRTPRHGSGMATPGHILPISRKCVLGSIKPMPKGNCSQELRGISLSARSLHLERKAHFFFNIKET